MQPYIPGQFWVNEPGRVFVASRGRSKLTTTIFGAGQLADLVERMLRCSRRRLDLSTPFVDAAPPGGPRLHVVIAMSTWSAVTCPPVNRRARIAFRANGVMCWAPTPVLA